MREILYKKKVKKNFKNLQNFKSVPNIISFQL